MDLFSDPESFSDSSSSDEQDDIEIQYGGEACSILSSLKESIGKIDDFLSFERGFSQGDVVCSATDPSGQMGRVVNIDMYVDLENLHGKKVKGVNSRILQKVRSTSVGDFLVHGPWLGKVDKIIDRVTVLFDDGTKCDFSTMGPEKLFPLHPDLFEDSQYPYYPGQRVRVELSTISKSARWLCGSKEKQDQGTICAVNAGLVFVDWISCALVGSEKPPPPPSLQDPKDLTFLACRELWQLGDMCILPSSQSEAVMEQIYFDSSSYDVIKEVLVIVKTKTKVDVLWQDGSHSEGLDSSSLIPINNVDAHDFWPEQFVLEKGASDVSHVLSGWRWGVVRSVDAKERTVRIKWGSLPENQAIDFAGKQLEETVSAYELVDHPDFSYCLGEIVLKLEKDQVGCKGGKIHGTHILTRMEMVENADLQAKKSSREEDVFSSNDCISSIGVVMGIKDGKVEVKWADGHTSKVAPYEVSRMDKYESSSPTPVLIRENVESAQYVADNEEQAFLPKGKSQELVDGSGHSLPQVAIGIFTNILGRLFGSHGFTALSGASGISLEQQNNTVSNKELVLESNNSCIEVPSSTLLETQKTGGENSEELENVQERKDYGEFASNYAEAFKQFDMVTGDSDHHFVDGAGKGLSLSQVNRGWLKKVQQEWCILEKDLPETIHVRAYEERMDLLRAVITGAPGTPYHDGLFFFDIFLPPEYPHEPPVVHYHSGGLRLNPNLYESGKICLSLLNTWTGTGGEVWNPKSSTILQVLLSLQALVLNEKPYFNEAGYDQQIGRAEGEKNSVSYNENAFLLSCKSMLYLIRKPPKHFEAFVDLHFKQQSKSILRACEAYMEGVPVGCAFGSEKAEQENQQGNSLGFKIMLSKLVPMLVEAFTEMGIDCS